MKFPVSVGEQIGKGEENVKGDIRKDKCQPKTFVTVEYRVTSQIWPWLAAPGALGNTW